MTIVTNTEAPISQWRTELREAVRDPIVLCERLKLSKEIQAAAKRAAELFPLVVPESYLRRIRVGDPRDPLLLQVLPLSDEFTKRPGDQVDPVGDLAAEVVPGLLKKYQGRALMVVTGACAIHCRYCFRRQFPYENTPPSVSNWDRMIEAVANDESISEVILSGGDPLTVVDSQLSYLMRRVSEIKHVRRLRIHTRLPIVIPSRVCESLLSWLRETRLTTFFVIHANHPNEIDHEVACSLTALVDTGVSVLNQSVLLRGVNDDETSLRRLSEQLVDLRVAPYYLHQLDRVVGASHFEVTVDRGVSLVDAIRSHLPGYAVPRYVVERIGGKSKELIG